MRLKALQGKLPMQLYGRRWVIVLFWSKFVCILAEVSEFTAPFLKIFFMHRAFYLLLMAMSPLISHAQAYTSFFTGDTADVQTSARQAYCLMGGRSENDEAMRWWLQRAAGGDVVVLRASGADGYNQYLFSELGIAVNSVQTLVVPNLQAANDPYVARQVSNAEAIWIAGGDQAVYLNAWRGTALHNALAFVGQIKRIPLGGTSAGMAVLGQYYFGAFSGSALSATVLNNPFHSTVALGGRDFLNLDYLANIITDTHFDNPDRKGRLITFMARLAVDSGIRPLAIACDEYTAVCIDSAGMARVFGEFPTHDDQAYFLQANCIPPALPETLQNNLPLTWDRNGAAVKVYRVKGNLTGNNSFDLTNWQSGNGGEWFNWTVSNGVLTETPTSILPQCSLAAKINEVSNQKLLIYPNPCLTTCNVEGYEGMYTVYDLLGRVLISGHTSNGIPMQSFSNGLYLVKVGEHFVRILKS